MSDEEIKKNNEIGCWPALSFQIHDLSYQNGSIIHEKNYETTSLANQIINDDIGKKIYYTKRFKTKNSN